MKIEDAYSKWSATYDQDLNWTRDLDESVTREIFRNSHHRTILEIGCGTGKNTSLLAQVAERVCAIDFSMGMIQEAKRKINIHRVLFTVADLTKTWPCKNQSAELVVCNLVLEHIENLAPIFSEADRVLESGGQFFVSELHPFRQYQGTQANFRQEQEIIGIPAFVHHLSDFSNAANRSGLSLRSFHEWWHETDQNNVPRLVSFLFEK